MSIARWQGKLDAIVGQYGMDFVGHSSDQGLKKGRGRPAVRLVHKLGEGKLAGAVNGDIQMQFSLCGVNLGQINVEIAYWIALALLLGGLIP